MPKVIVQTPEPQGSASRYVFEFVKGLRESGLSVTLFCPANFDYAADLEASGIHFVPAPSRPTLRAGLWARIWRNAVWVARTSIRQLQITQPGDIVHFQFLIHLPLGFIFLLLARLSRAKVVLTAHDPLPHKWRLPARLRGLEHKMQRWAYHLCDEIVVHNQVGKSILVSEFQYPEAQIAVVPHGPLTPEPGGVAFPGSSVLKLLFFGSIRENKGVHLAIEGVQRMNGRAMLTIAGSVTPAQNEYWKLCQGLISRDPASIDVMERAFDDSELAPLFAGHQAVLLPYLDFFSESGVASLAFSCQRPIIATGAGGLAELLEQSGGGVLIHSPSADSTQAAIEMAIALGPKLLQQMGMQGGQYLRSSRSWQTIGIKTRQIYLRLADVVIRSVQTVRE